MWITAESAPEHSMCAGFGSVCQLSVGCRRTAPNLTGMNFADTKFDKQGFVKTLK